jgi:hypothetical protein
LNADPCRTAATNVITIVANMVREKLTQYFNEEPISLCVERHPIISNNPEECNAA